LFAGFSRSTCQAQAQGSRTILNHTCSESIALCFAQTLGEVFSKTVDPFQKGLDLIDVFPSHNDRKAVQILSRPNTFQRNPKKWLTEIQRVGTTLPPMKARKNTMLDNQTQNSIANGA